MSSRGRGGRAPPLTGAKLFLKRSAQEAGLDDRNLNSLTDLTYAQFFPPFQFHSNGKTFDESEIVQAPIVAKRTVSQVYNIKKQRELSSQFLDSPYHVQPFQNVDVHRYGQKNRLVPIERTVLEKMGKKLATDPRFCPPELVTDLNWNNAEDGDDPDDPPVYTSAAGSKPLTPVSNPVALTGDEPNEESEDEVNKDDADDEVADADYTANYYESEEEEEFNDNGEATF